MQLDALRREAGHRSWSLTEYVDFGVSGAKRKRPQLDRLLADLRGGRIDVVAAWRVDRLSRSVTHLVLFLDELRERGVNFVSLTEGIDTTTVMGAAMFVLNGVFAELERGIIRGRVQTGVDLRRCERKAALLAQGLDDATATRASWGRPRELLDLTLAQRLLDDGTPEREVARLCNVKRTTLRRRLAELRAP